MTRTFRRGDHVELAHMLLDEIGADVVADLGCLHVYDETTGIWRAVPPSAQSLIVQGFAGSPDSKGKELRISSGDVAGAQRLALEQVAAEGFFGDAPVGVAFTNGFARVDERGITLEPHSQEHRARYGLGFAYEAGASSPEWDGLLRGLFRDDDDATEKIECLGQFFGACLLGIAPRFQRCLIASGGGNNGKSTLAKIVTAAMPSGSICAIAPQDMGQEYRRAMLAGKRLNIVNELPEASIIASEAFKAIVTGDAIVGRHIREAPFTFSPEAGHYFGANRLPGSNDQTEGFWRRFAVVEFNRNYKDDPNFDPNIAERIVRSCMPAVVGWMLGGVRGLMGKGAYTLPRSHEAAVSAWRLSSDQVAQFVVERAVSEPAGGISANTLYSAYRTWAVEAGHKNILARNSFGQRMRLLGIEAKHTKTGNVYPIRLVSGEGRMKD